jgi:hypothetical protein
MLILKNNLLFLIVLMKGVDAVDLKRMIEVWPLDCRRG